MRAVATLLRDASFAEQIEYRRRRARSAYEPFCPRSGAALAGAADRDRLVDLLHDAAPVPDGFDPSLSRVLAEAGLIEDSAPGRWELTAFRGVIAARDRAGGGQVYIGEDSLRFVDTILDAAPRGLALDVGAGSGITACALARSADRVISVDVVAEAVRATTLSAALNGVTDRVRPTLGRFQEIELPRRLNCIAANLPYVPVPDGFAYSPAGNGGPDGLALIRTLLEQAPEMLDPRDGTLVMRFQSLGDENDLLLLPDLRRFATQTGFDVTVTVDGRVPYEVRAALTALLAEARNPDRDRAQLLQATTAHLRSFGLSSFLACGLVARSGGTGEVNVVHLRPASVLDRHLVPARRLPDVLAARNEIGADYWRAARDLPDGFGELGDVQHVRAPIDRIDEFVGALADGFTVRAAADRVFADLVAVDPLRSRALLVTAELLAEQLLHAGLVTLSGDHQAAGSRHHGEHSTRATAAR
ncbi:50S ribosomal protein L11 methyltransferase [Actinoplanes sp. NPDC051346]|uniref:50S ribosomal protein L11 methyltransferase n=1 Tax=Actinoplanes sp. NPDC051346 TaxID=3155048 RepID=UPI0034462C66